MYKYDPLFLINRHVFTEFAPKVPNAIVDNASEFVNAFTSRRHYRGEVTGMELFKHLKLSLQGLDTPFCFGELRISSPKLALTYCYTSIERCRLSRALSVKDNGAQSSRSATHYQETLGCNHGRYPESCVHHGR